MPNQSKKGGAAQAAPLSTTNAKDAGKAGAIRRIALAAFAICGLLAAAARLVWFTPAVQEWRLNRASLPQLLKERGEISGDSRLLYHIGLRLNQAGRFTEAESNLRRAVALDPVSPRLRDEWARALLGVGKITEAFNQLRQFVGTNPNSAPGHLNLGKFYFSQKSMQRAREELEKAVSLAPENAEAWAYLSQATDQMNVPQRPLEAAQKAVALAPNEARYRLALAALSENANQSDAAGREFARAVELAPENAAIHQQYALWLYKHAADAAGRTKSEAEARRAIALDAKDSASQLLLGRLLRGTGRLSEAIAPLTQAATLNPEDPAPAHALAQIYTTLGKTKDAETWQALWNKRQTYITERHNLYFQLGATPYSRELSGQLARLLGTHGDVEGSLRAYAMALRRPQDSVQTLTAAARDLTEGGYANLALSLAERAVAQGSRSPEAREAFGDALLQSGRMDEAIAQYNYVTNYQPKRAPEIQKRINDYAAAHPQPISPAERAYREARSLMDGQIGLRRTPTRALELAEKANALDRGNLTYLQLLLTLQFGAKKTDAAIACAKEIVEIAPHDARTQALLAVMLAEKANTPAEFAQVQQYLDGAKNAPEAAAQRHYGAGLLALRRKDGPRAVAELTEAAKLDPAADVTFYKLSQAERLRGNPDAAKKALLEYERRQKSNREEFALQSDISQTPDQPAPYRKLADFYERNGRAAEAKTLREILRRRFSRPDAPTVTR